MITGDLASKLKGYEDEEEEDEDDMMAVEGSDGQQYVVLEVIQLADNQGTDQVEIAFIFKKVVLLGRVLLLVQKYNIPLYICACSRWLW